MTGDDRFEKFSKRWAERFSYISMAGLVLMLCVSVADIIGTKLFSYPIPGSIDIIGLVGVFIGAFAIALTENEGGHVRVDIVLLYLPKRVQSVLRIVTSLLSLFLFGLVIYASIKYAISLQLSKEGSMTMEIPFYPFVYAITAACIPVLAVLLGELLKAGKATKRGEGI